MREFPIGGDLRTHIEIEARQNLRILMLLLVDKLNKTLGKTLEEA